MKTSTWIIVAVVILAAAGIIFWSVSSKSDDTVKSNTNSAQEADPEKDTNKEEANSNNSNTNQSKNSAECTRTGDTKSMQEKIDIKNKFVTLSVEGFGDIKVQLYDNDAPKTVENFLRLTNSGYYDCLTFHRIAKGFVIQGGDPTGTGSGGESAFGGEFADELNPNTPSGKAGYAKGVLAMANRGPNTNTSQFFIMLADNDLPFNYTIFGKVVAGLDIVDKIGQVAITPQMGPTDGSPVEKVTITKATISDK